MPHGAIELVESKEAKEPRPCTNHPWNGIQGSDGMSQHREEMLRSIALEKSLSPSLSQLYADSESKSVPDEGVHAQQLSLHVVASAEVLLLAPVCSRIMKKRREECTRRTLAISPRIVMEGGLVRARVRNSVFRVQAEQVGTKWNGSPASLQPSIFHPTGYDHTRLCFIEVRGFRHYK